MAICTQIHYVLKSQREISYAFKLLLGLRNEKKKLQNKNHKFEISRNIEFYL